VRVEHRVNERFPPPDSDPFSRALSGLIPGISLLAALTVALSPFRDQLNSGTIAIILLVPVLVATLGGVRIALLVGLVGAGTFNFFFTTPYYSFRVDSGESIAALVAYFAVASIVAVSFAMRRDAVYLAGRRGRDAEFLLATSADIIRSGDPELSILDGLSGIRSAARLRGVHLVARNTWLGDIDEGFGEDARAEAAVYAEPGAGPATSLPLEFSGVPIGALGIDPGDRELGDDERRLVNSFAVVLSLVLRESGERGYRWDDGNGRRPADSPSLAHRRE
jgi:K+-sensing histidine kinase KdpD